MIYMLCSPALWRCREAMEMGVQQPNFLWLLAFNAFLAYFTNLTNFLVRCWWPLGFKVIDRVKGPSPGQPGCLHSRPASKCVGTSCDEQSILTPAM
jgi:hypothetical protein